MKTGQNLLLQRHVDHTFISPKKEIDLRLERKQKKRSFSCSNTDQDSELDSFLLRIEDAARTHVPFQVVMRAACMAMMTAEEQIISSCPTASNLGDPSRKAC
jgi:hypothetical protein